MAFYEPESEEQKERRIQEYVKQEQEAIKRILKLGFTKKQAEYLRHLENEISKSARTYVPPPMY